MTNMREPQPLSRAFESQVGSENKSICPAQSYTWNVMKEQQEMSSRFVFVVDSRNKVSCGSILWKTTLFIEDFPLLKNNNCSD